MESTLVAAVEMSMSSRCHGEQPKVMEIPEAIQKRRQEEKPPLTAHP
jgi:hypothetical protein